MSYQYNGKPAPADLEEAVEAAAQALYELSPVSRGAKAWSELADDGNYKICFRQDARAALEAAGPRIVRISEDAIEAAANQLRAQINDFATPDLLMRKRAKMVLLAAVPYLEVTL